MLRRYSSMSISILVLSVLTFLLHFKILQRIVLRDHDLTKALCRSTSIVPPCASLCGARVWAEEGRSCCLLVGKCSFLREGKHRLIQQEIFLHWKQRKSKIGSFLFSCFFFFCLFGRLPFGNLERTSKLDQSLQKFGSSQGRNELPCS